MLLGWSVFQVVEKEGMFYMYVCNVNASTCVIVYAAAFCTYISTSMCYACIQAYMDVDAFMRANSFIHWFIQEFIRRPFNKSTQRLPSLATTVQISLKQPAERTFIIFRQEADFQRESIPGGGTNNGECTTLLSCSCSTRYQYVCKYECKCVQIWVQLFYH